MNRIKAENPIIWDKLANKKIFFGHQSVGDDIIDGVQSVLKENPIIEINIEERENLTVLNNPVLLHSKNGQNGNPKSKIDSFCKVIEDEIDGSADIAGFKFCYADFNKNTDVENIFEYYEQKINNISQKYPNIQIIHFTVPIRSIQKGPKAWVKKLLNKSIGIEENYIRQQFNELIIKRYNDDYIFDIAKHESTYSDGSREFTVVNDTKIYSMIPDLTNDGGHLSNLGKNKIGTLYLLFLANVIN